ncbi:hypothetical protein PBY51_006310 [Eleginops maclovinus]|uniref:Uncharacterized protein n=1 Tax=Eleginops maclovinus TaxID=56733 RepID=A0AAN7WFX8_ELEMC|nr:hypothetical protein PBY51_006310 [Eleginops maclovinus]
MNATECSLVQGVHMDLPPEKTSRVSLHSSQGLHSPLSRDGMEDMICRERTASAASWSARSLEVLRVF